MWIVSPATGIDLQPQTRFNTDFYYNTIEKISNTKKIYI